MGGYCGVLIELLSFVSCFQWVASVDQVAHSGALYVYFYQLNKTSSNLMN